MNISRNYVFMHGIRGAFSGNANVQWLVKFLFREIASRLHQSAVSGQTGVTLIKAPLRTSATRRWETRRFDFFNLHESIRRAHSEIHDRHLHKQTASNLTKLHFYSGKQRFFTCLPLVVFACSLKTNKWSCFSRFI